MTEEQLINKKTGEGLSLSIIDKGYEGENSGVIVCVIEIKRNRIVSKTAKKNAK